MNMEMSIKWDLYNFQSRKNVDFPLRQLVLHVGCISIHIHWFTKVIKVFIKIQIQGCRQSILEVYHSIGNRGYASYKISEYVN